MRPLMILLVVLALGVAGATAFLARAMAGGKAVAALADARAVPPQSTDTVSLVFTAGYSNHVLSQSYFPRQMTRGECRGMLAGELRRNAVAALRVTHFDGGGVTALSDDAAEFKADNFSGAPFAILAECR